ncbi:MAG: regulatory iron-sulfur-containing complex subunit RicT [Cytophagales bacterium]|nr:regulatory iron-sulfur-containing complex subunit RicT [Cytophagales bacterium]
MGCGTCSAAGSAGAPLGCKSNGSCKSGGCNRLNTYDWLTSISGGAQSKFHISEVRFKGGRKEFVTNAKPIQAHTGDAVLIDTPTGQDIGFISLQGELVRLQMKKKNVSPNDVSMQISDIAGEQELAKYTEIKARELPTMIRTREIIQSLKLNMKLSDVEYQYDGKKAVFYYSADERIDFRELIKQLAAEFKTRVEMKQISLRQEAGRIGGIGICGRELCCSTWLTDFKNVNTTAARYQNLSINPQKLAGQCGRLKCCLNYELDTYMEALNYIPKVEKPILTTQGDAHLQKTDIFRKILWFAIGKNDADWIAVSAENVEKLLQLNKKGIKPNSLDPDDVGEHIEVPKTQLNKDLKKLDNKFRFKKR